MHYTNWTTKGHPALQLLLVCAACKMSASPTRPFHGPQLATYDLDVTGKYRAQEMRQPETNNLTSF